MQEGFFVADHDGAVVEMNNAFAEILGYPPEGLPYAWPHPWLVDKKTAAPAEATGAAATAAPSTRHRFASRDGHLAWVTVSINAVTETGTRSRRLRRNDSRHHRRTGLRGPGKRGAALGHGRGCGQERGRGAVDHPRRVPRRRSTCSAWSPSSWPHGDGEPTVQVAGEPSASSWRDLDPWLRNTFQDARHQLPLTAKTVEWPDTPGKAQGLVAVLSGTGDLALWLELRTPRWVSAEDRLLVTVLIGHLSLAMQHVRQFESARETSLTLQRAMLPPVQPPPGFAVRYEPAVPPLEIGGDWYDVLPIGDHRIGIVVGDCVGRGLPAAAIMGQLRSSARALLINGAEPAVLLEQLDSAASLIPDAYCTTVFLAILDTESGILRVQQRRPHARAVLAGPPTRATTTLLTDAASVPLAVRREGAAPADLPGAAARLDADAVHRRPGRAQTRVD